MGKGGGGGRGSRLDGQRRSKGKRAKTEMTTISLLSSVGRREAGRTASE